MENTEDIYAGLKEKLQAMKWPAPYMYKFVLPGGDSEKMQALKAIFNGMKCDMSVNKSKNGKYISLTIKVKKMYSANAVIEKYMDAAEIEGIIAL
jgi:putative lipoic acid-binding regulatory protein